MALDVRHLQLLQAVADGGTLAAASRQLHLSPSALSHQLRDAEQRLGSRLFQRRNRRLLFTRAGERMLKTARTVLRELDAAERAVAKGEAEDVIRLSTGCYTCYGWLAPMLAQLAKRHPRVETRLVLEATRQPLPALLAGELDVAITTDAIRHPRLKTTPLFEDELVALMPAEIAPDHATAATLAQHHVVVYDAPFDQLDVFTRVFWPAGLEPVRTSKVPLTEAIIELVRAGVGVGILARWALPRDMSGLEALRIGPNGLRRRWRAVVSRSARSPAIATLIELLKTRA